MKLAAPNFHFNIRSDLSYFRRLFHLSFTFIAIKALIRNFHPKSIESFFGVFKSNFEVYFSRYVERNPDEILSEVIVCLAISKFVWP